MPPRPLWRARHTLHLSLWLWLPIPTCPIAFWQPGRYQLLAQLEVEFSCPTHWSRSSGLLFRHDAAYIGRMLKTRRSILEMSPNGCSQLAMIAHGRRKYVMKSHVALKCLFASVDTLSLLLDISYTLSTPLNGFDDIDSHCVMFNSPAPRQTPRRGVNRPRESVSLSRGTPSIFSDQQDAQSIQPNRYPIAPLTPSIRGSRLAVARGLPPSPTSSAGETIRTARAETDSYERVIWAKNDRTVVSSAGGLPKEVQSIIKQSGKYTDY